MVEVCIYIIIETVLLLLTCVHVRNFCSFYIPASVLLQLSYCQKIMTTLLDGKYACPGQEVIFTCITNGSVVVAWISDDYIGSNGRQLEFASNSHSLGAKATSTIDPNTFAELTMKEDGLVTESQLYITVSQEISSATVTCIDVGTGSNSVHFELLCKYTLIILITV